MLADGFYGVGGVSFSAASPARTHYSFAGRPQSRFEVFLRQPAGGMISPFERGPIFAEVDTAAATPAASFVRIEMPPRPAPRYENQPAVARPQETCENRNRTT